MKRAVVVVALLGACTAALPATAAEPAASSSTTASTAPSSTAPERVAVFDITIRNADTGLADSIAEIVAVALQKAGGYDVISGAEVKALSSLDARKQLLGCTGDNCFHDVGTLLNASRLVSGSVTRLPSGHLVVLQMIDTRTGSVASRAQVRGGPSNDDALSAARQCAGDLLKIPARLHLVEQPPQARVFLNNELVATTPVDVLPFQGSGEVVVRVEHIDYPGWQKRVALESGQTTRVRLNMVSFAQADERALWRRVGAAVSGVVGLGLGVGGGLAAVRTLDLYNGYQNLDARRTTQATFDARATEVTLWTTGAAAGVAAGAGGLGLMAGLLWMNDLPDEQRP